MQAPLPSASGLPSSSGSTSADRAPLAPPASSATEIVRRPDPGLARGRWEAPEWLFWALLAVVVLGSTFYVLRRIGRLRFGLGKRNAKKT